MAKKKEKKVKLGEIEQQLLNKLHELDPTSAEYKRVIDALGGLREAKAKTGNVVSKDTVLKCSAYVVALTVMMVFESENPIRTKLLSFIPKPKL